MRGSFQSEIFVEVVPGTAKLFQVQRSWLTTFQLVRVEVRVQHPKFRSIYFSWVSAKKPGLRGLLLSAMLLSFSAASYGVICTILICRLGASLNWAPFFTESSGLAFISGLSLVLHQSVDMGGGLVSMRPAASPHDTCAKCIFSALRPVLKQRWSFAHASLRCSTRTPVGKT